MKQFKIIIATVLFSVLGFIQVNASDTTLETPALPVELKFAGTFKNQPLIQLNFTGSTEDNAYSISVTDETGIVLYNADVKGGIFSKQFLLNTDDLGEAVLNFEITGRKSGKKAVYKVSRQTNVSQQMDIVKL
jgi:hypothetical protein